MVIFKRSNQNSYGKFSFGSYFRFNFAYLFSKSTGLSEINSENIDILASAINE
ncbi:MAG: hypothetical protein SWX82_22815 [Cyanobacteriota bacterium]|nr:hypothetical protein [Cyanobacteriota bacterium]